MLVPLSWLKEYVDIELSPDELADRFDLTGTAVESVKKLGEGLDEDVVFEFEITPNRPDCLGVIGIAREAAAITGASLKIPDAPVTESGKRAADVASVEIADAELCPRYEARLIMGVSDGESPRWLKRRLEKAGVRPISNIVDATNYVMLETGQPLHAFDYDLLAGAKIIVRRAKSGDRIVTIDDVERLLDENDLVIADAERVVAIAGIMGGEYSEVSASTVNVLLEAAHFKPDSIMRTSRKLGLLSEASVRFEKGVDPNIIPYASDRAAELIRKLAGGEVLRGEIDVYPKMIEPRKLGLRTRRVNRILGTSLETREISTLIGGLGLESRPTAEDEHALVVTVPTFRFDLEREIDLVEEVARIYGYNTIESTLPTSGDKRGGLTADQRMARVAKERLVSQGLFEAETYSFVDDGDADLMNLPVKSSLRERVKLINPLSEEQSVMRTSLLPGLIRSVKRNIYREQYSVKLFEMGRVYRPKAGAELPDEKETLGIALTGPVNTRELHEKEKGRRYDFYDVKGILIDLIEGMGIGDWSVEPADDARFHPGRSAALMIAGEPAGAFGQLNPVVQANFDLAAEIIAAEIDFGLMLEAGSFKRAFTEIPRRPAISLDVAVVVDEETTDREMLEAIRKAGGDLLESARVFDIFRGGAVPAGKKSIAYSMTYRAPDRTLTDEEAKEAQRRIVDELERRFHATVRG